jgi:sugar phosphate isomerase/epimerase
MPDASPAGPTIPAASPAGLTMPDVEDLANIGWVLWAGTIGFDTSLTERLAAAEAGGYDYVSLGPQDVERAAAEGVTAAELALRAADSGVRWVMDPIMNWHPTAKPSRLPHARFSVPDVLRMCEQIAVASISPIAASTTSADPDEMAADLARLADAAADIGAVLHLEFMPMSAVPDLATAWRMVEAADRPNCGLMFDTWHFFRSQSEFALLESIPGDRIRAVQVSDAHADVRGTLWQDTANRLLPGDGVFDLRRALGTLVRIGGVRCIGAEVISPELAACDSAEVAIDVRGRIAELLVD